MPRPALSRSARSSNLHLGQIQTFARTFTWRTGGVAYQIVQLVTRPLLASKDASIAVCSRQCMSTRQDGSLSAGLRFCEQTEASSQSRCTSSQPLGFRLVAESDHLLPQSREVATESSPIVPRSVAPFSRNFCSRLETKFSLRLLTAASTEEQDAKPPRAGPVQQPVAKALLCVVIRARPPAQTLGQG